MRLIDAYALLEQYNLKDATKYGNKNEEQQAHSYSTLMLYEIADMIEDAITEIYDGFVNDKADEIIKKINISAIVEQKLNDMDVEEVEELVMSVMKNELQAVINLGALIGAVIGIINIFF